MTGAKIEHVNLTVGDVGRSARLMEDLFGWQVRWRGTGRDGGQVIHIGSDDHYLALWSPVRGSRERFEKGHPLNHVGIEVDDLDAIEERVVRAGLTPFAHGDYEPGRRFYFFDHDGIEFEVVSYAPARTAAQLQPAEPALG